jgi:hypothetical protein
LVAETLNVRADANLDELMKACADMERAAGIIGQAMLRP